MKDRSSRTCCERQLNYAPVSQLEDYLATNESVAGSSPVGSTIQSLGVTVSIKVFDTSGMGSNPIGTASNVEMPQWYRNSFENCQIV